MRSVATGFLCILVAITTVSGYSHFQLQIPNGETVPHPCKANYLWRGVGHKNHLGGGANNQFGLDFKAHGFQWTRTLCNLDSDGDGKSNGEELGDPDCSWTPRVKPARSYGLSHPGVCDPFDSPRCNGKPEFVDCEHLQFECETIDESEVFNFTVRMPTTPVPVEVTTFICMAFAFPSDQETGYHIVANTPYLDNMDIMHHMLVLGCEGDINMPLYEPYPCGMSGQIQCHDLMGGWTVGSAGQCGHKDSGYLVGVANTYKYAILQYHWNNPAMRADYFDSSGMTFYLTPKLRPYNAGIFLIGQFMLFIPPGQDAHEEHGRCTSECTTRDMSGDITITRVFNHMHYLGKAQFTHLNRQSGDKVDIAVDEPFNYDNPVDHDYSEGIRMRPGDELTTTCVYKSTSRTTTTFQGDATNEEMCYSFITYYPKENLRNRLCVQAFDLDACHASGLVNGCNYTAFSDPKNPHNAMVLSRVLAYCTPGMCRSECLNFVRDVKMDPCFQGEVGQAIRKLAMRRVSLSVYWYAAFDSCDEELAKEASFLGVSSAPPLQCLFSESAMLMVGMILTRLRLF